MTQIEVSAVAGSSVSFMKSVRPGPGLEVSFGFPKAVRCIEDVVLVFGSLKEVEFHKAGYLFQVRGPGFPDIFEFGFVTLNYAKAVHCDEVHVYTTYGLLCRKPTFSVFVYAAGASADFRKSFFIAQSIRMGIGKLHGFEVENCLEFVLCCCALSF